MVGQRWDMDIRTPLDFSTGWQMRMVEKIEKEGSLTATMGSDYFIFPQDCFTRIRNWRSAALIGTTGCFMKRQHRLEAGGCHP